MKSGIYRFLCFVLCLVLTIGTLPADAAAVQRTGHISAGYAVTKDQYGRVYFENMDDLKQLAAGTYSEWTFVHYNGKDNLIITEDVTIPAYMSLQVYPGTMVIQKGVTLTTAPGSFIQCAHMTVNGTLNLNSDMNFGHSLTVKGKILASGNIEYWDGMPVYGAENIIFAEGCSFHISQEAYSVAELKEKLLNAKADSANYYHITPIFGGNTTIDTSLEIPENVTVYINTVYTDTVTVGSGVSFTIKGRCNFETKLLIKGKLVNNGHMDYIGNQLKFSSTGSYAGNGTIHIYQRDSMTTFSDVISGLNPSRFTVVDTGSDLYGFYWKIRDMTPVKPSLTSSIDTSSGKPVLKWEAVPGAEKYRIYRSISKSGTYKYVKTVTKFSYTDTAAEPGSKYYYKIRAYSETAGYSAYSNIVTRMCDLAQPTVSVTGNSSTGRPVVKWELVDGAKKYFVYRASSKSGSYSRVDTAVSARSYMDNDTTPGKTYYYKVKAIHENTDANSACSDVVKRMCDLKRPVVTVSLTSAGNPYLKWGGISGAEKYYVYRATSKTGTFKYLGATTSEKYVDKNVIAGKTYYYKVKAVHANTSANSAYSAIDSIQAK